MKKFLPVVAIASLFLVACSAQQEQEAMTAAESLAWSTANAFETANTGGVLTNALLDAALVATDNTSDIAVVNALGTAANAQIAPAVSSQAQAAQAKLAADVIAATQTVANGPSPSPAAEQAAATAVLSNPAEIEAVAAVAPTLNAVAAGSGSTTPSTMPPAGIPSTMLNGWDDGKAFARL